MTAARCGGTNRPTQLLRVQGFRNILGYTASLRPAWAKANLGYKIKIKQKINKKFTQVYIFLLKRFLSFIYVFMYGRLDLCTCVQVPEGRESPRDGFISGLCWGLSSDPQEQHILLTPKPSLQSQTEYFIFKTYFY